MRLKVGPAEGDWLGGRRILYTRSEDRFRENRPRRQLGRAYD